MKTKEIILMIVITFFIGLGLVIVNPTNSMAANVTVTCTDKNFYDALVAFLKENQKTITENESEKTITIDETVVSGITEIELSNKNITNITGIEKFTSVTTLDLSNNKIIDLSPLNVDGLKNKITNLNLSNNEITDISVIAGYTILTDLDLGYNQITNISYISNHTALTTLYLNNNQITSVSDLASCSTLSNLYIQNNEITSLDGIQSITTITGLYAANNNITDISNLSTLTLLTTLDLSGNQITGLTSLSSFSALVNLYLENCGISDLTEICKVTSLKDLNLAGNNITAMVKSGDGNVTLNKLTQLKKLNLSNNKITEIPDTMKGLTLLEELNLENTEAGKNEITSIANIVNFTGLKILNLNGNKVSELPTLTALTKLEELYLKNNSISDISNLDGVKTTLTALNLAGNSEIKDIEKISELTKLEELDLTGNATIQDIIGTLNKSNLTELKSLVLRSTGITEMPQLTKFTKLESLDISSNGIEDISLISSAKTLKKLYLTGNNIKNIEPLKTLTNLVYLSLTGNVGISDISAVSNLEKLTAFSANLCQEISNVDALENLTELRTVWLGNNKIKDISKLSKLTKLKELKLEENEISDIGALSSLTNLTTLEIQNNKISKQIEKNEGENIELPQIITEAKVSDSKIFTDQNYILENCTVSQDNTKITVDTSKYTTASIKINGGKADGTTFTVSVVDNTPPVLSVSKDPETATKGNVTVTITANEEIQSVTGWTLSSDHMKLTKIYDHNVNNETVKVKDLNGHEATASFSITNIDKEVEGVSVNKRKTTDGVEVTIQADEELQPITGWTLSSNHMKLTKTYNKNGTYSVTVKDLLGNEENLQITINEIEEDDPGTDDPGTVNPGTDDPEDYDPGYDDPDYDDSDYDDSDYDDSETGDSDYSEPQQDQTQRVLDEDNSLAGNELPYTGIRKIVLTMVIVLIASIITFIKYRSYKEIK